jgi:hypothetical protein
MWQATGYIFGHPEAATCAGAPREGEVLGSATIKKMVDAGDFVSKSQNMVDIG